MSEFATVSRRNSTVPHTNSTTTIFFASKRYFLGLAIVTSIAVLSATRSLYTLTSCEFPSQQLEDYLIEDATKLNVVDGLSDAFEKNFSESEMKSFETSKDLIVYLSFQVPDWPKSDIKDAEKIAYTYARYANPDAVIVLLVDDVQRIQSDRQFLDELKMEVHAFNLQDPRLEEFDKVYKHTSVNNYHYESMCFKRFILLDSLVQTLSATKKFTNVLMPDSDIILLSRISLHEFGSDDLEAWRPTQGASYFTLFSLPALTEFAAFILEFYKRKEHLVYEDILQYGDGPQVQDEIVQLWMPTYNSSNIKPLKQFSDMHLSNAWFEQTQLRVGVPTKPRRLENSVFGNVRSAYGGWDKCCQYPSGGIFHLQWKILAQTLDTIEYWVSFPNRSDYSIPGLHFQGNAKSSICLGFCPYLLPLHRSQIHCCNEAVLNAQRAEALLHGAKNTKQK